MAYKRITLMDIYEIIRRWHDQKSISHIAMALNNDRKTIRKYIAIAKDLGLLLMRLLQPYPRVAISTWNLPFNKINSAL
ncbi:MAG: hypothetical protein SCK70_06015 [bacterium]|nr:hypothetical protein [bacterium]